MQDAPPILKWGETQVNVQEELIRYGFSRVIVLDAEECGITDMGSLLLAVWPYHAEINDVQADCAWIHPYYDASQQAYQAAVRFAETFRDQGIVLRDDILVKPILARVPFISQGKNTLSYIEDWGSRFHLQILTSREKLSPDFSLESQTHELHCGNCRQCIKACPTNALEGGAFHRERCLRNWQMSGKPVPEELRQFMGNSLIGCDICQRVCPHNSRPDSCLQDGIPLSQILSEPKAASAQLRMRIGANLSIPNRVLSQACLIAGSTGSPALLPLLTGLQEHPSSTVAEHAAWAVEHIRMKHM